MMQTKKFNGKKTSHSSFFSLICSFSLKIFMRFILSAVSSFGKGNTRVQRTLMVEWRHVFQKRVNRLKTWRYDVPQYIERY